MQPTNTAALLQAAPEEHSRRCALAKSALDLQRWPAAACGLRHAAKLAEEWASQARWLADWCDTQDKSGITLSAIADAPDVENLPDSMTAVGAPTAEAIEAGLLSLANALGHGHAVRVRRAMNDVLTAQQLAQHPPMSVAA